MPGGNNRAKAHLGYLSGDSVPLCIARYIGKKLGIACVPAVNVTQARKKARAPLILGAPAFGHGRRIAFKAMA